MRAACLKTNWSGLEQKGQSPRSCEQVRAVARALGLRAEPLTQAVDGWMPQASPSSIPHVETLLGSIGGYEVKAISFMIVAKR